MKRETPLEETVATTHFIGSSPEPSFDVRVLYLVPERRKCD